MYNRNNQNCRVIREEMASLQLDTLPAEPTGSKPVLPLKYEVHACIIANTMLDLFFSIQQQNREISGGTGWKD